MSTDVKGSKTGSMVPTKIQNKIKSCRTHNEIITSSNNRIDGAIMNRNQIKINETMSKKNQSKPKKEIAYNKSPEDFRKYGENGIQKAIDIGHMSEQDAQLIRNFVRQLRSTNGIGEARAYKLTNALSNSTRFIKTPFTANTIYDIYDGIDQMKEGKKLLNKTNGTIKEGGKIKQNSLRDYMMTLKRFYLWLIDEGLSDISKKKIREIKLPKQDKMTKTAAMLLTEEEILSILQNCWNTRDRALIAVLYEGGFRISEVANLTWDSLKFDKHYAIINTDGKTEFPRFVPLHMAREYLIQWRNNYPGEIKPTGFVFLSAHKGRLTYAAAKKQIKIIADRAGIKKSVNPHIFRHSRITHLIQQGYQETTIKQMMWSNVETGMLQTYAHLTNADIMREVGRHYGIVSDDNNGESDALKIRNCPRCYSPNPPTNAFCGVCGTPMTAETAMELNDMKDEIHASPVYSMTYKQAESQAQLIANQQQ